MALFGTSAKREQEAIYLQDEENDGVGATVMIEDFKPETPASLQQILFKEASKIIKEIPEMRRSVENINTARALAQFNANLVLCEKILKLSGMEKILESERERMKTFNVDEQHRIVMGHFPDPVEKLSQQEAEIIPSPVPPKKESRQRRPKKDQIKKNELPSRPLRSWTEFQQNQ